MTDTPAICSNLTLRKNGTSLAVTIPMDTVKELGISSRRRNRHNHTTNTMNRIKTLNAQYEVHSWLILCITTKFIK